MAEYKTILISIEERVATITLNRPQSGNAFAMESYTEIRKAIESLDGNPEVGAIVLTGAGKHFSTGGDIVDFKRRISTKEYVPVEGVVAAGRMGVAPKRCSKPVIAMINGTAAGAGASLALACDFRLMTVKSNITMAFINMGFSGDTGGAYYLERLVGMGKMTEMMMTGKPMGGEEAAHLNVAILVEEEEKLSEATYNFARKLANGPLVAYKWQKQLFLDLFYHDINKATSMEAIGMNCTSMSEDFSEAVHAFLEKRVPVFHGR